MTILSNHRLHSYKATASLRHRIITPKKTPMKQTIRRRITITFPPTEKSSTITKIEPQIKTVVKQEQEQEQEQEQQNLSIEGMNIYEDLFGGWNPQIYEALNQEYDLDNSADYEDYLTEADNEEAWEHLDYLEWLTD